jgi:hypothetical protein
MTTASEPTASGPTASQRIQLRVDAATARTRSVVWPGAVAILLFAVIVYIQFSLILGASGFIVEFVMAIGFYYCWAWHCRLVERAKSKERAAES